MRTFARGFTIVAVRIVLMILAVLIGCDDDVVVVARRWRTRWSWTDALFVFVDLSDIGRAC